MTLGVYATYRSGDEETWEQVPEAHKEGHDNSSNLTARSQGDNHHSIHWEVGIAHKDEVIEIQELLSCPLEPNHWVQKQHIEKCLNCNINSLYGHLKRKKQIVIRSVPLEITQWKWDKWYTHKCLSIEKFRSIFCLLPGQMHRATLNTFLQLFHDRKLSSQLIQQIALQKHWWLLGKRQLNRLLPAD